MGNLTQTEMGMISHDNIFSNDSGSKYLLNQSGQTVINKIDESNYEYVESPSPTVKK